MRPANNGRRTRGRPQRRQNQQPMRNTVYDSNGPETRVRGNASQICEKYMGLARDAASASDHVKMEAYYQHAEHYQRILNSLAAEKEQNPNQASTDETEGDNRNNRNQRDNNRDNNRNRQNNRGSRDNNRDGNRNNRTDNRDNRSDNRGERNDNRRPVAAGSEQSSQEQTSDNGVENLNLAPAQNSQQDDMVAAMTAAIQPVVDLSEVEQPSIAVATPALAETAPAETPAETQVEASDGAPVKKTRAPAKPRATRTPRAPRKPRIKKADEEGETKAFGDAPLPSFLEADKE